jgi:hypothetical protein
MKLKNLSRCVPAGGCWFRVGSRQLHMGVDKSFRPANKAHPAFAVDEIEKLFAILSDANIRCTWDEARGGLRRFYAIDRWGNRLEITEPTC